MYQFNHDDFDYEAEMEKIRKEMGLALFFMALGVLGMILTLQYGFGITL